MDVKGQIAIFVIVAIVIVTGILIIFFVRDVSILVPGAREFEPSRYLDQCIRDSFDSEIENVLVHGGVSEPRDFILVDNLEVNYICKNVNYYEPCISQYPLFVSHLQEEIVEVTNEEIISCVDSLKTELESRGYDANIPAPVSTVVLKPGIVELGISSEASISRDGVTQNFDGFDVRLPSAVYDLGYTAQEIARQEAEFCYFEYVGYALIHPEMDIRLTKRSDGTKVYSIKHIPTDDVMNIAIRGCALPAGF